MPTLGLKPPFLAHLSFFLPISSLCLCPQFWHKACFHCETCKMTLNMKMWGSWCIGTPHEYWARGCHYEVKLDTEATEGLPAVTSGWTGHSGDSTG